MGFEKIALESVTSSNLAAIGYHHDKQILAVQFNSGHIYHYANVTPEVFADFCRAGSLGRFYSATIRSKYEGQKMTGHCPKCGILGWVGDPCLDCGCATVEEDPRKDKAPV